MIKIIINSDDIQEIEKCLSRFKDAIISTFIRETSYSLDDVQTLWSDMIRFIENFLDFTKATLNIWVKESTLYQKWEFNSTYDRVPWGKVLICSPGNAPIPLIPIMLLSFSAVGNEIILSPSRKTLNTAKLLFECISRCIGSKTEIAFYDKGCKNAMKEYVETGKVNLLYFQGGSKFRNEIYNIAYSNGVEVIFEGGGNVVAIIEKDCAIESTVKELVEAKKFCGGQMCTSPNMIFVHESILDVFKELFLKWSAKCNPISVMKIEQIKWIESLINDSKLRGYVKGVYPQNCGNHTLKPALIEISKLEYVKHYLNNELFSPYVFIVAYNDINYVLHLLKTYWKYGLQISLFTKNKNTIDKIKKEIHVGRITININPTYQNSLLPWGGYKLSGFSYVMNFLEKATKPVIIESNRGDKK